MISTMTTISTPPMFPTPVSTRPVSRRTLYNNMSDIMAAYNRVILCRERDDRATRRSLGLPAPERLYCYFCGKYAGQYGNNCAPLVVPPTARCCDHCNNTKVIAARRWHMRNDSE